MVRYVLVLAVGSAIGGGCEKSNVPIKIDQKEISRSALDNCRVMGKLLGEQATMLMTDEDDPEAVLIEFTWTRENDRAEHKLECYYKSFP